MDETSCDIPLRLCMIDASMLLTLSFIVIKILDQRQIQFGHRQKEVITE